MSFSSEVVNKVLVDTGRCCAICHKFCGTKIELHHIRQKADGGEDTYENCIPLCLDCHADVKAYNPHHPKGRKYSDSELIMHRDKWYSKTKNSMQYYTEEKFLKLDEEVFKFIKKQIYESGVITFLREHDFGGSYQSDYVNPMVNLMYEIENNPEVEFINADLEQTFANLIISIKKFLGYHAQYTFPHDVLSDYRWVPQDWLEKGEKSANRYYEVVNKLNEHSTNIVINYDMFAKLARRLFVS
jgi:hypothetical protein